MKLIKWIELISPNVNVIIFVDNEQEARYEGPLLGMPWYLVNYEIGRINEDEPILISYKEDEYGAIIPVITINLFSSEFVLFK